MTDRDARYAGDPRRHADRILGELTVRQLVAENDRHWPKGWVFHRCPAATDAEGRPKPASHSSLFHGT